MKTDLIENQQKITLSGYYNQLAKSDFVLFRNRVCRDCDVSLPTFYRWLRNPADVAPGNRFIIENIVGQKLIWE